MNSILPVFTNVTTVIDYLCILSFSILLLIGINTIIGMFISIAWSEIKLWYINKKHRKDN